MSSKGFTLVELLAVIVILGIILLIAVPNVANVINNSREASFRRTAEAVLRQSKKIVANNPSFVPGTVAHQYRLIPLTSIPMEINRDAWGDTFNLTLSYVLVIRNATGGIQYGVFLCSDNASPARRRVMGTTALRAVMEGSIETRPIVTTTAVCPALPLVTDLTVGTIEGYGFSLVP